MDNQVSLKLRASIKKHEGLKLKPYRDSKNILSIGWGRNLEQVGISESEAEILLSNDIANATYDLYHFLPWVQGIDDVSKAVLIEMCFNMGIENLLGFREFLEAVKMGDREKASKCMLDSLWANQVHGRSNDLAFSMEKGFL